MTKQQRTRIQNAQSIDFQIAKATKLAAQLGRTLYIQAGYYGFSITDNRNAVCNSQWTEVGTDGTVTFRDRIAELKAQYA